MAKRKKTESKRPDKQPVETAQIMPFGSTDGVPDVHVSGRSSKVNKTVPAEEALGLPKKKEAKVKKPQWAREKEVVDKLTLAQKKEFLRLHADGAQYSAFSAYLGKSRGVFDYMTTHSDDIKAEVSRIEAEKDKRRHAQKVEAAQLNELGRQTGKLETTLEQPKVKRKKRWEVAQDKQRWLVQESGVRGLRYLTAKYHGGVGPVAEAEVAYEIDRLETALAKHAAKAKAAKAK